MRGSEGKEDSNARGKQAKLGGGFGSARVGGTRGDFVSESELAAWGAEIAFESLDSCNKHTS